MCKADRPFSLPLPFLCHTGPQNLLRQGRGHAGRPRDRPAAGHHGPAVLLHERQVRPLPTGALSGRGLQQKAHNASHGVFAPLCPCKIYRVRHLESVAIVCAGTMGSYSHSILDRGPNPPGSSTVAIILPALVGFVFAKFLESTDCAILSCSMASGGMLVRVCCALGWTLSIGWEVAVLSTYNLDTWWRKWVPALAIPFAYASIFTSTPDAMQTSTETDPNIKCRIATCTVHDVVSLSWGFVEVILLFFRPKLPSYPGVGWLLIVGASTIFLNIARMTNPNEYMMPSSEFSQAFGALEVLVLLAARSAAAEALCM